MSEMRGINCKGKIGTGNVQSHYGTQQERKGPVTLPEQCPKGKRVTNEKNISVACTVISIVNMFFCWIPLFGPVVTVIFWLIVENLIKKNSYIDERKIQRVRRMLRRELSLGLIITILLLLRR